MATEAALASKTVEDSDSPDASVALKNKDSEEGNSGPGDVIMSGDDDEKEQMLKAARQIEFYFADSNLPYDRFMWTLHTANPEHWVPISTVASFKRMRTYTSRGMEWVTEALRMSAELEVDEGGGSVRRRREVVEPKDQFARSVYAKGFGKEEPGLQLKLEEFFGKYGRTNAVRMRRIDTSKEFKGSVFAEFADFNSVETFLTADPKPSWDGQELLIMSKEAYCDMKIKEKGLTGKAADMKRDRITSTSRRFNAFSTDKDKDKKHGAALAKSGPPREVYLEFMGTKLRIYEEDGVGSVKEEDVPHVKGATMKFEGCGGDAVYTDIKAPLRERFTRAPFIKYTRGADWGLVGFDKRLSEEDVVFVKENVRQVNGRDVVWSVAEEEEEKVYQMERAKQAAKAALEHTVRGTSQGGGRGGGRGGKGGRGGRGGRGGGGRGRDKGGRKGKDRDDNGTPEAGDKRKRAVEPDGGPDVGVRGQGVPVIQSTAKKAKVDSGTTEP